MRNKSVWGCLEILGSPRPWCGQLRLDKIMASLPSSRQRGAVHRTAPLKWIRVLCLLPNKKGTLWVPFLFVFAPSVRYKIPIYNSGFTGVSPCAYRYFYGNYPIPKKRSKKPSSFAITPCFFSARFPPPKRDMGGSSLSMSVPVVLTAPSRNAISIN